MYIIYIMYEDVNKIVWFLILSYRARKRLRAGIKCLLNQIELVELCEGQIAPTPVYIIIPFSTMKIINFDIHFSVYIFFNGKFNLCLQTTLIPSIASDEMKLNLQSPTPD